MVYVPKFFSLHYTLRFGEGTEGDVAKSIIPKWRTVFRGIRRHKHVPDEVLHYHRSIDDTYGSIIETVVNPGNLSVLFVADNGKELLARAFDRGIERIKKALSLFPDVSISEVRFILEVTLNAPDGSEPAAGEAVFYLPKELRVFGEDYDTSLSFRWDVKGLSGGTLVLNILPMDSKGKHIHGRYAFRTKLGNEPDGPLGQPALLNTLSLLGSCFEYAPHMVSAVHLSK